MSGLIARKPQGDGRWVRWLWLIPAGIAAAVTVWLVWFGGARGIEAEAAALQHQVQNAMAGALRRLQGGDAGALALLWGLCFAYGFVHAAGPGHGKLVIGSYGLGARVALRRLVWLALASSLAQAAAAVALVYAGLLILGLTREAMQGAADGLLRLISAGMIALIGLWLGWRGIRGLLRLRTAPPPPQEAPLAGLGQPLAPAVCATCGHAHGPDLHAAEAVTSWREAVALVAAIAIRPCTGALFLLILTWRVGLGWAGITGAFVMGLGTALVTVLVAVASVSVRESALLALASTPAVARAMAVAQLATGALIVALALGPLV